MKPKKHGKYYQITYRCPNYPKLINETFDTEEEANLRIAQIQLEKKLGTLLPPSRFLDPDRDRALYRETMTVSQLMTEYVRLYGLSHWSVDTLSCNRHRINDYILPYIGDVPIKSLTTHQLEQFYLMLQTEPAVKRKGHEHEEATISLSIIEKIHALIRNALNQAIRWDYLRGSNPANSVELSSRKVQPRDVWSDQEAQYALSICADPVLKLCLFSALGYSMRIGEILGLTWDCVHIDSALVQAGDAFLSVEKELRRVSRQSAAELKKRGMDNIFFTFPSIKKSSSTTILVLKTPKTDSSVRNIFVPETVAAALQEMKQYQESLKAQLSTEYQDFNLVVAQNNGRPYEEHTIAQKLRMLIQEHDLKPVVFHSLHHCSTSVKLKISGGDIKAVQGDTGHAQANMVTDVYSHIMNGDRKRLAKKMDTLFFSSEVCASSSKATLNESSQQIIQLLEKSPDLADLLLQMTKVLGDKSGT